MGSRLQLRAASGLCASGRFLGQWLCEGNWQKPLKPGGHACLEPWEAGRDTGPRHAGHSRQGAHRHLLVGFHAIQHHLDDLPAQLHALLRAVLRIGQVEEGSTAGHLNVLVILVALEGCDDQLCEDRVGAGAESAARGRQGQLGFYESPWLLWEKPEPSPALLGRSEVRASASWQRSQALPKG